MIDIILEAHGIEHNEPIGWVEHPEPVESFESIRDAESHVVYLDHFKSFREVPGTEVLDGGIAAIRTIYNSVTGVDIPEKIVEEILCGLGLWSVDGMSLQNMHDFFEKVIGLPCALLEYGTFQDICAYIENGVPVVLSGDIGEILGTDALDEDTTLGERADYAFIIKDIDYSDPNNPTVTLYALNGSGAEGYTIPLSVLEDAWADGGCDYLILGYTEEAAALNGSTETDVE
jgi:hypothetical protein